MIRLVDGDGDYLSQDYERGLRNGPRRSSRVEHEAAESFPEDDFTKLMVDCNFNPGGLEEDVPLVRIAKGGGFSWQCNNSRCLLHAGKEIKARLALLAREVKGRQIKVIGVLECQDMEGFSVK